MSRRKAFKNGRPTSRGHFGTGKTTGRARRFSGRRTVLPTASDIEGTPVTTATVRDLLVSEMAKPGGMRCALSGRPVALEEVTLDHVVPSCLGGRDVIENLQVVTAQANTAKGTLSMDEFVELCCDVARHVGGLCDPTM